MRGKIKVKGPWQRQKTGNRKQKTASALPLAPRANLAYYSHQWDFTLDEGGFQAPTASSRARLGRQLQTHLILEATSWPCAPVAQKWTEQRIPNPCVPSSSLGGGANNYQELWLLTYIVILLLCMSCALLQNKIDRKGKKMTGIESAQPLIPPLTRFLKAQTFYIPLPLLTPKSFSPAL